MDPRLFSSWNDLSEKEFESPTFLIDPYVATGGITFLWGASSIGKSPLGWSMARAVGTGEPFFGLPVTQGRVLYIELDTPARLVADRIQKLPRLPEGSLVDFLFLSPLSIPVVPPKEMELLGAAAEKGYDFVIINTLRKAHTMNDKEAQTVAFVYGWFQRMFPGAALMFVHHTKKSQLNTASGTYEAGLDRESFSGAMNWFNDAQIGIHLKRYTNKRSGTNLSLCHEKSQVSRQYKPLQLRLESDGSTLSCPKWGEIRHAQDLLAAVGDGGGHDLDEYLATQMATGMTKARELRLAAGQGVWLTPKDAIGEDKEED